MKDSQIIMQPKEELPTIFGIPVQGYYDQEISYKELVSLSNNDSIDTELHKHYKQVIANTKNAMKDFNCGMERFIFLQNPTTCRIRIWFD